MECDHGLCQLQARLFTRIMLHDDITIPYLVTMIDHGCYISWLQRSAALRGRQHKTYNKRIISKSAAGHPRYMTEQVQQIVNKCKQYRDQRTPEYHHAASQAVPQSSHSPMRGGSRH